MSDQPVREIQLGGKQLVFLFMASVVVAVAIFLLGVSVGRGVRTASADAATSPTEVALGQTPGASAEMPPATETTPADLQYHDQLQGTGAPPPAASSEPQVTASASAPAPTAAPASAAVKPPAEPPATPAAPPGTPTSSTAPKTPTASTPPPASGGWYVQVNSFRSRENADRQAAQLRSKGYSNAAVAAMAGLYRVRIGPFADRAEANRMAARLSKEEGFKPSVQP